MAGYRDITLLAKESDCKLAPRLVGGVPPLVNCNVFILRTKYSLGATSYCTLGPAIYVHSLAFTLAGHEG